MGEISGYRTIRHVWTSGLLQATIGENVDYEPVRLSGSGWWCFGYRFFSNSQLDTSTQWFVTSPASDSTRRIQSMLHGRFLNVSGNVTGADVRTYWSQPDWGSQRWYLISIPGLSKHYLIFNAWSLLAIAPSLFDGTPFIRSTNRLLQSIWTIE